jgi:Protein of unknown function (DUF3644)/EC042_2821-lke REase
VKARSKELLDRAIAATVAAIEIYNKPDFIYREETFSILVVNAWELLFKAKWLLLHKNKARCLYVSEKVTTIGGEPRKRLKIKKTRSGNPLTHGVDWLADKLIQQKQLEVTVWNNIQGLLEIRDSAVHFYNPGGVFSLRLQEIGAASLKNFVALVYDWFKQDLHEFNFYQIPLSFVTVPKMTGIILNPAERNFLKFVDSLEGENDPESRFSVTVNIDVRFTKSKAKDALAVIVDRSNPTAQVIRLTEEQIRERYKWDYTELTKRCRARYTDFKVDKKYHSLRKSFSGNQKFMNTRLLDPGNPKSQKKDFFDPNILQEFDSHYRKRS